MTESLAPAHFALLAMVLLWDIFMAGQIAQLRNAPRTFTGLSAIAGLLIAPALLILVASASLLTGRTIHEIAWVWPACTVVFAVQALYATSRRLVSPLIGVPIAVYNVLVAAGAVTRYVIFVGETPPRLLLGLSAAQAAALGLITGGMALSSPLVVQVPLLSPAYPARWRISLAVRFGVALLAVVSAAVVGVELPRGILAVRSYDRFEGERLQEHPAGDFVVGLRVFPRLGEAPPPLALRQDLSLVDTLGVRLVSVVLEPAGAQRLALDSLAHSVEQLRRDSTLLVVTLGYGRDARLAYARSPERYTRARLADVERIARRLRPDILLPADEPYLRGTRALGRLPVAYWRQYLERAAVVVHGVNRRIAVGVSAGAFDGPDSALYAWAASRASPIDVVGFALFPSFRGATSLQARLEAANRWMRVARSEKPHWVFAAGGYPAVHGEASQERALLGALAWATSQPGMRGLIVADAGDYGSLIGLRTAAGRVRPAAAVVARAVTGLREAQP